MTTSVSSKGQIVLPVEIRRRDQIEPGQEFEVERLGKGEYLLRRKARPRNEGFVNLLLSCPVKDWYEASLRGETIEHMEVPTLG